MTENNRADIDDILAPMKAMLDVVAERLPEAMFFGAGIQAERGDFRVTITLWFSPPPEDISDVLTGFFRGAGAKEVVINSGRPDSRYAHSEETWEFEASGLFEMRESDEQG